MRLFVAICTAMVLSISFTGQDYLGSDVLPLPADSIEALPYVGGPGEYCGPLAIGDMIPDFQVYDLEGTPMRLYDELRPDKYTIVFTQSLSCGRVQDGFDPQVENQVLSFITLHGDQFNWIGIYTAEAHPADEENCPSNCANNPTLSLDGSPIYSHQTYGDRMAMATELLSFANNPEYTFTYPFDNMYLDNPDNAVLVDVFQAPFGMAVVDCAGTVVMKHPFMNQFFQNWMLVNELLTLGQQADTDQDQICNAREEFLGSDPEDPCDPYGEDSDGDGECDLSEQLNGTDAFDPCDPIFIDVDGDGICDLVDEDIEIPPCELDPTDSDDDGYCDAEEILNGSDPEDPCSPNFTDSDGDGICNNQEIQDGTNAYDICDPDNADSDGDGYCDLEELAMLNGDPFDPCVPDGIDSDGDGICNLQELQDGTSPADACDPYDSDLDGDGYCDLEEELDGTNPEDPCDPDDTDTDGDGVCDNQEIQDGTDPFVDESVGVNDPMAIPNLRVYPNPMGDQLFISAAETLTGVSLLAADGRLIYSWNEADLNLVVDVSALASGTYTLKVLGSDGAMQIRRLLK